MAPPTPAPCCCLLQCGLDRGPRCAAGYAEQLEAFEAQLMLAQELQRPVSVRWGGEGGKRAGVRRGTVVLVLKLAGGLL